MIYRILLPLAACAVIAGCEPPPYDTQANRADLGSPVTATATPIPAVPPAPAPVLQLRNTGSVVGLPVVDPSGQSIGTVQAVAAERGTGQVRYLVIASPSFGLGYYISVPAEDARTTGDRVILNAPAGMWMQSPRYAMTQINEMYRPF